MTKGKTKISIQTNDFTVGDEISLLEENNHSDGAVVTFSGRVRNKNLGKDVIALTLEHYPQMTEKSLSNIVQQARSKWQLNNITIIHRIGKLALGEQIVFVGVTSEHRQDAFSGAEFIMDYLKVSAPFWKKEVTTEGEHWLDARESDQQKAQTWDS